MEPPPRSLALDAHYCIMVRVAWPTEYKYASAIGCACWRAPLGIDSVPTTTCDRRPNAEPMASAFPGSRRGHGRPSNKQRDKTTRTSALTEITPYKWLADYDIPGVDGLALHHLYRAMAWLGEELPADQQGGPRPLPRARSRTSSRSIYLSAGATCSANSRSCSWIRPP